MRNWPGGMRNGDSVVIPALPVVPWRGVRGRCQQLPVRRMPSFSSSSEDAPRVSAVERAPAAEH